MALGFQRRPRMLASCTSAGRLHRVFPRMEQALAAVDFVGVGINSLDTLIRLPHFPAFNSKLQVLSSEILPGGQVATAAVACQRWGLRCRYVGKVGDDQAGRLQRESIEREGIESHWIEVPDCASQQAFILVDESSGERTILWQRDARLDIDPRELQQVWISNARLLHVDGHPSAPAIAAARWARKAGMIVMSDLDNLYTGVEALLECVDFAICSRDFPERVTGIADLVEALQEMPRRFGCKFTGATLGSDGVLVWDGSSFHYSPAFRVPITDTTGAGDLFHAGLAYALLKQFTLDDALEFSCAAAALNCTAIGARGGIRPIHEIKGLIRDGARLPSLYDPGELRRSSSPNASGASTNK